MNEQTHDRERILKERMCARSASLQEYIELAYICFRAGRYGDTLATFTAASELDLTPCDRAVLLSERAHFLFVITGAEDEALGLAEQALLILREHPGLETPEAANAEIMAGAMVSRILWRRNPAGAAGHISYVLSRIETATQPGSGFDVETVSSMCITASHLHALSRRFDTAIEWARRAVAQPLGEADRITPLVQLGCVLSASGRGEEARAVLEEALRVNRNTGDVPNPAIHEQLGLAKRSLGREAEAIAHLEEALQIVQNDEFLRVDHEYIRSLHDEIAEILRGLEDYRAEARHYRSLLAILGKDEPAYWISRLSLARCEMELLRFDDARENLQTILEFAPSEEVRDSARADLLSLRYTVAGRNYEAWDYPSAIRELESLLSEPIRDNDLYSDVLLLLAHSYASSTRFADARRYYQQLISSPLTPQRQRESAIASMALLRRQLR